MKHVQMSAAFCGQDHDPHFSKLIDSSAYTPKVTGSICSLGMWASGQRCKPPRSKANILHISLATSGLRAQWVQMSIDHALVSLSSSLDNPDHVDDGETELVLHRSVPSQSRQFVMQL